MSVVLVAEWIAREETAADVLRHLDALARASLTEPGCVGYRVHRSTEDPNRFLLYEEYRDISAIASHTKSEHFQRLAVNGAIPLLAKRVRTIYEPLDTPEST
jgi:quinol monooxygenase YgiN